MVPGQAEMTQLMIMLNLFDGVNRPSDISKKMDITLQGVQYHLKILKNKGLVTDENTVSPQGFEYLYSGLNNMRGFVSENIFKLDRVITWEAISSDEISKGDVVYLKMEGGYLTAHKSTVSPSVGRALTDGVSGGIIGVTQVEGIIDVSVKGITIIILPDVEILAKNNEVMDRTAQKVKEVGADLLAVIGEVAKHVSDTIGEKSPLEYAPLEGCFEAARRGLSSVMLVSKRRFRFLLEDLKSLEKRNEEVSVTFVNI